MTQGTMTGARTDRYEVHVMSKTGASTAYMQNLTVTAAWALVKELARYGYQASVVTPGTR